MTLVISFAFPRTFAYCRPLVLLGLARTCKVSGRATFPCLLVRRLGGKRSRSTVCHEFNQVAGVAGRQVSAPGDHFLGPSNSFLGPPDASLTPPRISCHLLGLPRDLLRILDS